MLRGSMFVQEQKLHEATYDIYRCDWCRDQEQLQDLDVRLTSVGMANVGKRKAFSIGAEKHGVNAFSQNEIEHFECCDDDAIASGEVSVEDIMALVNEKTTLL
ncbi:hypothetical protein AVEN_227002-1 [Araneus ventricosus]|uniref:Uncharacterized protein n=1 Tax=Araneus ventricosus TaxID=182803 RepID=A0A4Y2IXD0_ARAVE|nr:hypothetical protein AVEN_227002-1 [Araneus ventricosus]